MGKLKLVLATDKTEEIQVKLVKDEFGIKLFVGEAYVFCIDDKPMRYWFFPGDLEKLGFKKE